MLEDLLVRTPDFREMDAGDIRLTAALRLWVVLTRLGRCPMPAVAGRLASADAAVQLHILLEEIGSAWPEPFRVAPPCCPRLSHDEALAVAMVRAAAASERPAFDRLLQEMLPAAARDRLFLPAEALGRLLAD
jgi:hypothetical protein